MVIKWMQLNHAFKGHIFCFTIFLKSLNICNRTGGEACAAGSANQIQSARTSKKHRWKSACSNVFTINLIFPGKLLGLLLQLCLQTPLWRAAQNLTSRPWQSGLRPDGERPAPAPGTAPSLRIESSFGPRDPQRAAAERDRLSLLNPTLFELHLSEGMIMCSCRAVIRDGRTGAGAVLSPRHSITVQRPAQRRGIFTWPTLREALPLIKV